MVRCSVLGCKSNSETKIPNLSFHTFPGDGNLRRNWIEATGRTNWSVKKSSKICSRHFETNVLIKKKSLTVLRPNAVPLLEIKTSVNPCAKENIETSVPSVSLQIKEETMEIYDDSSALKSDLEIKTSVNPCAKENIETSVPSVSLQIKEETMEIYDDSSALKSDLATSPNYSPWTMQNKLKRTQQKSKERLKKLRAVREKNRRLSKKIVNLENIITELKAKYLRRRLPCRCTANGAVP